MHRGLAEVADVVDVGALFFHQQFDCLEHLTLGRAVLVGRPGNACRRHQWRDLLLGADRRVCAMGEQYTHDLNISRLGRQKKRGCTGQVPAISRAGPPRLLHADAAVHVRTVGQQRFDDAHAVDLHRDELIAQVPVGDVHGGVQRLAEDIASGDAL